MTVSRSLHLDTRFNTALSQMPLIAILRGVEPTDAVAIAQILYDTGIRLIEVPLNSPDPFDSIADIRRALPTDAVIGAGTVTTCDAIEALCRAGGELVVMPHANVTLIEAAKQASLLCLPGIATPTEAFAALAAGADGLKLFPSEMISPAALRALRSVLPAATRIFPVGGIHADSMAPYYSAGVTGFGLGSALYKPGMTHQDVAQRARTLTDAWRHIQAQPASPDTTTHIPSRRQT